MNTNLKGTVRDRLYRIIDFIVDSWVEIADEEIIQLTLNGECDADPQGTKLLIKSVLLERKRKAK